MLPRFLMIFLFVLSSTAWAGPLDGMEDKIQALIDNLRAGLSDKSRVETEYMDALSDANEALRAYYGVAREFYVIYGVKMSREEAAKQVSNTRIILNQKRTNYIWVGGAEKVFEMEIDRILVDMAYEEILMHSKQSTTTDKVSGVYEALTSGALGALLSQFRVEMVRLNLADLSGWEARDKANFELNRAKMMTDYERLMKLIMTEPRARVAFESATLEKFSSLNVQEEADILSGNSAAPMCLSIFSF